MKTARSLSLLKTCAIVLCRGILPLLSIFFILIMPNFIIYHFTQDLLFDWTVRIGLAAYFCVSYWRLPGFFDQKPGLWLPVSRSVLLDPILLKGWFVFLTMIYSLSAAGFTLFIFSIFLPPLEDYRFIAAGINGLVFLMGFFLQYQAFMQLAAIQEL